MRLTFDLNEWGFDVVPLEFLADRLALHLRDQPVELLVELLEA
jgi:hypothetical protein